MSHAFPMLNRGKCESRARIDTKSSLWVRDPPYPLFMGNVFPISPLYGECFPHTPSFWGMCSPYPLFMGNVFPISPLYGECVPQMYILLVYKELNRLESIFSLPCPRNQTSLAQGMKSRMKKLSSRFLRVGSKYSGFETLMLIILHDSHYVYSALDCLESYQKLSMLDLSVISKKLCARACVYSMYYTNTFSLAALKTLFVYRGSPLVNNVTTIKVWPIQL